MDLLSIRFIQEIRYFTAAYEEGNFTRASEREHCTQSGLSTHIKSLESMLSQQLFERHARGVTPTVAGKCLYSCCTNVLGSVKEARQRMLELAGNAGSRINVGVPLTFGRSVLPPALQNFLGNHPFVEIRMTEGLSDNISVLVEIGGLEVAIVTEPPASFGLESTLFFSDRLVLVTGPKARTDVSKSAAISSKKGQKAGRLPTPEKHFKLVLSSPKHGSRRAIESKIRLDSLGSAKILEIDGLEARLELVRSSDWATILPAFAVARDVKEGRLAAERIPGVDVSLDYFLVQRKGVPISPACNDFLQIMKDELLRISGQEKSIKRQINPDAGQKEYTKKAAAGSIS
jgi:LysR family transcriptional regulator, nitrogen assimilation regulatory protein